jgi:CRP-like cAMP-binding protein
MNDLQLLALIQARGVPERWDHPTAKDWAGVLATSPLFTGVSTRRLRKLARGATSAEFAPGETIIFAEDRGDFLYVILGGDAKAVSAAASRMLGSGDYFGEVAMIDGGPRPATVVAISYVHVMKVPAASVLRLAHRHPVITLRMLSELITRLRHLETQAARAA